MTDDERRDRARTAFIELYRHDLAGRIVAGYVRGQVEGTAHSQLSLYMKGVLDEIGPLLGRYFDAANPAKASTPTPAGNGTPKKETTSDRR